MDKHKVVVTGRIRPVALERIRQSCDARAWESVTPVPMERLCQWLEDAEGLFITGDVRVTDDLLHRAPRLRVVVQASVGYDNVDVAACTRRRIPFGNTPGVLVEATADLAFGLILCSARRIHEGAKQVEDGRWRNNYEIPFGVDLFDKTLGIAGMGSIGAAVARRAQASGMRVIYHNRKQRSDDQKLGVRYVSFEGLLRESDFLLVLVPLTDESRHLFDREAFARMKPTAYFINAARGGLVDTNALYEALASGRIAHAALDVTEPEPLPGDHPLLSLPNVLVTPHIGSATHETRDRMAHLAVDNLFAGLERRPLPACVNEEVNYREGNW